MVSRLLRPSAVVLATFTAAKTDDVNSKSSRKISELPIYSTEEVKYLEYKAPERTELEEYIARVRRKVWTFGENVEERFVSMKKRYMMVKDKVIELSLRRPTPKRTSYQK
ncbi:uncharacterized protein LOC134195705 [Corticium candelabrum]|uniref:uncharacterized protein LOC134195705 n=1 Tax=Corticium candelabrum TaxID=121492 RepID=UPI002E2648BA|nr:uncharacterized protein LOC134195705 [Corticium candelabrum]